MIVELYIVITFDYLKKATYFIKCILYILCRTREACAMVTGRLIEKKISAKAYHAGLKNSERDQVQEDWMEGRFLNSKLLF